MAPDATEGLKSKVVGGGISTFAGVDAVLHILTNDGLYGALAASNETAATAVALFVLVTTMLFIASVTGLVQFSSPR